MQDKSNCLAEAPDRLNAGTAITTPTGFDESSLNIMFDCVSNLESTAEESGDKPISVLLSPEYLGLAAVYPESLASVLHKKYCHKTVTQILDDFDQNGIHITQHPGVFGYIVETATRSCDLQAFVRIKEELIAETHRHLDVCARVFPDAGQDALSEILRPAAQAPPADLAFRWNPAAAVSGKSRPGDLPIGMTQILDAENPKLFNELRDARNKFLNDTLRVVVEDEGLARGTCAAHAPYAGSSSDPNCKYCLCQPFTPSLVSYGCLIRCCGHEGDIASVIWLWNHLNIYATHSPESTSYGCLLDALVQGNEVFRALRIFRYMQGESCAGQTTPMPAARASLGYEDNQSGFTDAFDDEVSLRETRRTDVPQPNNITDVSPPAALETSTPAFVRKTPIIKPNTIMYSTLIKGFAQLKMSEWALALHEEMTDRGIPVNTVTFNSLVNACARSGAMKEAAMILDQMMKLAIQPDLVTFSTVVKGYCIKGEVERAFRLMVMLKEKGGIQPDSILYNTLLDGCVRFKKLQLCEQVWKFMQAQDGIKPSNFTLTIFIKLYGKLGQMNKVFQILEEFPEKYNFSLNAHVYTCVMSACINNRLYHLILPMFQKLLNLSGQPQQPRISQQDNHQNFISDKHRHNHASSSWTEMAGSTPDIKSYETALAGLHRGRLFNEGIEVLAVFFNLPTTILEPPSRKCSLRNKRLGRKHVSIWLEVLSRKRGTPIYRADVESRLKQLLLD